MQPRESRQRSTNRDCTLHSRQWRAETIVNPFAESEMLIRLSSYLERVRIGKLLRVAICRGHHDESYCICLELNTIDYDISFRITRSGLDRAIVAQHLLDRARHQLRLAYQLLHLFGITAQCEHSVADQVGSGF